MLYCCAFEFYCRFIRFFMFQSSFWESSLFLHLPHNHVVTQRCCTSLFRSDGESSFPSSWSCFYEAMTLLLRRCASGHCHLEWWNFSLGFFQWDPEGSSSAVIRSSFPTPTLVKVPAGAKQTFKLKSEDAFLLMMRDARQRSHTSKKKKKRKRIQRYPDSTPDKIPLLIKFQMKVICCFLETKHTCVFVGIYKDSKDSRGKRV